MQKLAFLPLSFLILVSCYKAPDIKPAINYYPMNRTSYKYSIKGFSSSSPQSKDAIEKVDWIGNNVLKDTITWKYSKDTIVGGKSYSMYSPPNKNTTGYLIRKEDHSFYRIEFYYSYQNQAILTSELNFLNENIITGNTWTDITSGMTDNYTVLFTNAKVTVNGKVYDKVLGIQKVTHRDNDTNKEGLTSIYYYADGIGEIYSYEPYPLSGKYQDVKKYLIE